MVTKIEYFETEESLRRRLFELQIDGNMEFVPTSPQQPLDLPGLNVVPFSTNMIINDNSPHIDRAEEQRHADECERFFIERLHDLASCLITGRQYGAAS